MASGSINVSIMSGPVDFGDPDMPKSVNPYHVGMRFEDFGDQSRSRLVLRGGGSKSSSTVQAVNGMTVQTP